MANLRQVSIAEYTPCSHYRVKHLRSDPMKIGELARKAGCQVETVRYYEREGLLPAPKGRR